MAFNINILIDRVKKKIGLNGMLTGIYTDKKIREIILKTSLADYNKYCGFFITGTLDEVISYWGKPPSYMVKDRYDVHVVFPSIFMDQIKENGVAIKRVEVRPIPIWNRYHRFTSMKDKMYALHQSQFQKDNRDTPRFTFRPPNVLVIEGFGRGVLDIYKNYKLFITCEHPESLATISKAAERNFEELCVFDVMDQMFKNDLAYLKVDIGNGQVELQLDHFRAAEQNRQNLIQKMEQSAMAEEMEWVFGF